MSSSCRCLSGFGGLGNGGVRCSLLRCSLCRLSSLLSLLGDSCRLRLCCLGCCCLSCRLRLRCLGCCCLASCFRCLGRNLLLSLLRGLCFLRLCLGLLGGLGSLKLEPVGVLGGLSGSRKRFLLLLRRFGRLFLESCVRLLEVGELCRADFQLLVPDFIMGGFLNIRVGV